MTLATNPDPRTVISAMRRILEHQCVPYGVRPEISRFIQAERLLIETHWPGYVVRISERGRDYIYEHNQE